MEAPQHRAEVKAQLMVLKEVLLPEGNPVYLEVIRYPMIKQLKEDLGYPNLLLAITMLVKDFCASVNVVRNMNEDQIVDVANMLITECGNFRLEDYVMMFELAKRGRLVKLRDRLDIEVITEIMDEYWLQRHQAAERHYEAEVNHLESLGTTIRQNETLAISDRKLIEGLDGLATALNKLKDNLKHEP